MANERSVVLAASTAVWLALVGFLTAIAMGGLAAPLLRSAGVAVDVLPARAVVQTVVPPVGFGAVAVAYAARSPRIAIHADRPEGHDWAWIVVGPIVMTVGLLALTHLATALGLSRPSHGLVQGIVDAGRPELLLLLATLSVAFTGPGEELLFRGAIQGRLRASMGPLAAIGGASALFAVVHLMAFRGPGVEVVLAQIFVLTLLLGAAYERRDNILVPALIHGLYNATQFLLTYVGAAGV